MQENTADRIQNHIRKLLRRDTGSRYRPLYKLTDRENRTRPGYDNECIWGEGVTHRGTGEGDLCGPGYIHAYTHPLLAVLLNPIHGDYENPRLWEAEGEVIKTDELKVGCVELTTLTEMSLPEVTTEQRIRFAILCALEVYSDPSFIRWAERWLSGEDRSVRATADAAEAAHAVYAADTAHTMYAADAADSSAAAYAADAAYVAADAYAANAAKASARAAYEAADAAPIDLIALAEEACSVETG